MVKLKYRNYEFVSNSRIIQYIVVKKNTGFCRYFTKNQISPNYRYIESSHSLRITQIYCIFHLAIHNLYTAKHVHVFFQLDVVDGETNIKLNSDP